jgi:hypothetical protein
LERLADEVNAALTSELNLTAMNATAADDD